MKVKFQNSIIFVFKITLGMSFSVEETSLKQFRLTLTLHKT